MVSRLASAPEIAALLRSNRIVVSGLDGSHMGLAVNMWGDLAGLTTGVAVEVERHFEQGEILRSAVEVILAMAEWVGLNDRVIDADSPGDAARQALSSLSDDCLLRPSERVLCADLADALALNPETDTFTLHRVRPSSAIGLIVFLARAIEHRFGIRVEDQFNSFRNAVLRLEGQGMMP